MNIIKFLRAIVVVKILLLSHFVVAQSYSYDDVQKIRNEAFGNSSIREFAVQLTDVIGPRLSGGKGLHNACTWAKETLEGYNLSNAQLEPWGNFGKGWEMEKFYIAMKQPYYQPLVAVPQAWTGGTNGLQVADVVLVDASSEEMLLTYSGKLQGKVVITPFEKELEVSFEPLASRFTEEEIDKFGKSPEFRSDPDPYMLERMRKSQTYGVSRQQLKEFCEAEGALAIIENSGSFGTVRSYGDRNGRFLDELGILTIDMTHEHYARMVRLIDRGIDVSLELDVKNRLIDDYQEGVNVIAELPGADKKLKDEVVMIGAHIDSWHAGTGGNDNASGVILMMEVMRILKQSGVKLDRTVRIALWTGEEQGLLGSKGWVDKHVYNFDTNEKGPEYDKISAYYNFDYGTGRIKGIFLHDNLALKPIFQEFFEPLDDLGVSLISNRNPGSSDHVMFNRIGIPGFALIQDRIDYGRGYHTNMDTFERIQLGDLKQAAAVVATLVYQTANFPTKLPRKQLP